MIGCKTVESVISMREIENSGLPQESHEGEEPEFDGDDGHVDADDAQEQLLEGMKKLLPLAGSQAAASTEVILVEGAGAHLDVVTSEPTNKTSAKESEGKQGARAKVPSKGKKTADKGHEIPAAALLAYDPEQADKSVRVGQLVSDKRFWQVARTLTFFVAGSLSDKYVKQKSFTRSQRKSRRAKRVTNILMELGPTFIKLGQFLSVRRDILSVEVADELAFLQDKVPPFDIQQVKVLIERELGAPPEKVFRKFEEEPLASASIGQVHRAWLPDGRPVVVKVQRPNLAERFYQDLGYMRLVTRLGNVLKPSAEWDNWLKLSDEFGRTLFAEIDYLQEGKNADRLRQILKEHTEIRIPRVSWKYTGKRVLTLEYIPGTKVDNKRALEESGLDLVAIGNRLVSCYLDQVLLHGFFHADPHAGNLAIDEVGNVILYDFGMIGEITPAQRDAIMGCIIAVIRRDSVELVKHLKTLEVIRGNMPEEPFQRALSPFIDYYAGRGIRELDFSHLETDIDQIAYNKAIRMPPTLAYLLRAGTSLEGIARTLHPNFSFVEAAKPSMRKWIMKQPDQAAKVLKLMGSEYSGAIKNAWMALFANSKMLDGPLSFLKSGTRRSASSTELTTTSQEEEKSEEVIKLLAELAKVKSSVNVLEKQIEQEAQNRVNLLVHSVWFLSFSLLFMGASCIPNLQAYAPYFLIGNGVMVARIIGHLIRSDKLMVRSSKKTQSGGNGEKRC